MFLLFLEVFLCTSMLGTEQVAFSMAEKIGRVRSTQVFDGHDPICQSILLHASCFHFHWSWCLFAQNISTSSAVLPGILPAISSHLFPTSLCILKTRSSSASVKSTKCFAVLLTSFLSRPPMILEFLPKLSLLICFLKW